MSKIRYEMTEDDLKEIMEACKPVPMIALQCGTPRSPQENANSAWSRLGDKMGFDYTTVEPTSEGDRVFMAEPLTTNLCDTCQLHITTCDSNPSFGNGYGNDNVFRCDIFEEKV